MKRQKRRASQHSCPDQPITATAPHFSPPAAAPAATVPAPPTEADCQESDAERVKKYELLNQIGHEVLNRELDRAKRKEETAARYFAVFALLLGVTTSLGRDVVKQSIPPHDRYQWACVLSGLTFLVFMLGAIGFALAALKHEPLEELFLKDEVMERLKTDPYFDFLHALTLAFRGIVARNRPRIDRRADHINRAHSCVVVALCSLVVCTVSSALKAWKP